ncbi:MAG: 16S rRNA (cytidine(1402)-2'-O)-methyltransferase [Acidimicrobiales bacterium]
MSAPGRLVLVATPIGNLGDLSPRARDTLAAADVICCEDTRRTRALLTHAGISGVHLLAVHGHNEMARRGEIVERVRKGQTVALVTDAGTPAVSDPGARLVAAAVGAGVDVSVIPGPNAALCALVVSGLPTDRFCFEGFLPRRGSERRARIEALVTEQRTVVLHEAPLRVGQTLADLAGACDADRRVVVVRELTKMHEQIWRGTLGDAGTAYPPGQELRGEVVIVIEGAAPPADVADEHVEAALDEAMSSGASLRDAASHVAQDLGLARRRVYELGLRARRNAGA